MKFIQYLKEEKSTLDELTSVLEKDCKPFLDVIRGHGVLWRGSPTLRVSQQPGDVFAYKKITPRTNRIPRNTAQDIHEIADNLFKQKFGWKVRSEGVFASTAKIQARTYGDAYLFFPVSNFKYVFSKEIQDFYGDLPMWWDMNTPEKMNKEIQSMVDTYQDTGLQDLIKPREYREVIFKVNSYYIVDELALRHDEFKEFLGLPKTYM